MYNHFFSKIRGLEMISHVTIIEDMKKIMKISVGDEVWGSTVNSISWQKEKVTGTSLIAIELEDETTKMIPERWVTLVSTN